MNKMFLLVASLVSTAMVSCVAPPGDADDEQGLADDEDLAEAQQAGTGGNPNTGGNHHLGRWILPPATVAQYQVVGAAALDADGDGVLPSINWGHSHGYDVWDNLVYCALGVGQSLTEPNGAVHQGHFGLATSWTTTPLTTHQQRFVTGCMLQRLNAWGHEVPILLEGRTSPIYHWAADEVDYPWDESTVWGNVFVPSGAAPAIYVCSSGALFAECNEDIDGTNDWLEERICDGLGADCGLAVMGLCSDVCTLQTTSGGDTYEECTGASGRFRQTVHVQLPSTEASCTPVP